MHFVKILVLIAGIALPGIAAADATNRVRPGRAGVPIIINGVDVSHAVVEGDWGLDRGVHVQPTVYGGRRVSYPKIGHYFPSAGHAPGYGRLEVEPAADRELPKPAESYHETWSAQSAPPAPPAAQMPFDPRVILAPRDDIR